MFFFHIIRYIMSICEWEYNRIPHIVTVLNDTPHPSYIYFGEKIDEEIPDIDNDAITYSPLWLENDDSVTQILNKLEATLFIKSRFMYLYVNVNVNVGTESKIMAFEYFIRKGKPVVIKTLSIPANINNYRSKDSITWVSEINDPKDCGYHKDGINLPKLALGNVNKNSTESFTLASFNLDTITVGKQKIHKNIVLITYDVFIKMFKSLNRGTFNELAKLYYPLISEEEELTKDIRYTSQNKADKANLVEIERILELDKHTINLFANPKEYDNSDVLTISDCNILEVVIHVNYDQPESIEFIDPIKVFDMFRLTKDIPFTRYRGDSKTMPKFRIYKDLTNPASDIYMDEKELREWIISTKISKDGSGNKVYSLSGKGLSYKQLLYITSVTDNKGVVRHIRKYLTLNIYKDGKLEIKCYWDEKNPGNIERVMDAVSKVRKIIEEINKLQFHINGVSRKLKIKLPELDFLTNPTSNTKIAFFNIMYDFKYIKDDTAFISKISQFAQGFNTYVSVINNGENIDKMEMRYKRVNGYIKMNGVYKFINDLERTQNQNIEDIKAQLKTAIANRFNISLNESDILIRGYLKNVKGIVKTNNKDVPINFEDALKNTKHPGINIKITKSTTPQTYKIFILGVTEIQLKRIYYFIKHFLNYYINQDKLADDIPSFKELLDLGVFLDVNTEDDTEAQNKAIIQHEVVEGKKHAEKTKKNKEPDDNDDEYQEEEEEHLDEESGDKPVEPIPAPVVKAKKKPITMQQIKDKSVLQRLKEAAPELFDSKTSGKNYPRTCQASDFKQPHVIEGSEGLEDLKKELQLEIARFEEKPKDKITADEKKHLKELKINLNSLKNGANYKGNFYFCPKSWDYNQVNFVPDNDRKNATKGSGLKPYFVGKFHSDGTHKSYLTFTAGPSAENCLPCCFEERGKAITRKKECLGETTKGVSVSTNKDYILADTKTAIDKDRIALLPKKLNDIFNNGRQCKPSDKGQITENYNCILRKGTTSGENYFLNCLAEIKQKSLRGYDFLNQLRTMIDEDTEHNILRSLKRGSIFNIFSPETEVEEPDDEFEDPSEVLNIAAKSNFLNYMQTNKQDINETYLWDFVSMPGVVARAGINLFIIEGFYEGNSQKTLKNVVMKCPNGYDTDVLYNKNRSTVILYKYDNIYEIICSVTSDARKSITHHLTFPPEHLIVNELIKMSKLCAPVEDQTIKNAYNQYIKYITKATKFDKIFSLDYNNLTSSVAIELIANMITHYNNPENNDMLDNYSIQQQVVDTYHKVRYFELTNGCSLPIYPSGLVYKDDLDYTTDVASATTLEKSIITLLTLENYGNMSGYGIHPYAFLIDPGEDLDDPADDIVIGVILSNGSHIITTDKMLVSSAVKLKISVPPPSIVPELPAIEFDCSILKFDNPSDYNLQYSYYDENELDKKINEQETTVDFRQLYTVRTNFEEESYERLRFELSKYLQIPGDEDETGINQYKYRIKTVISDTTLSSDEKREELGVILDEIFEEIVITELPEEEVSVIEQKLGPLGIGFEQLKNDGIDLTKYELSYIKPLVRYECNNPELSEKLIGDIHCSGMKLFISSVNLSTGNINNIEYYRQRIVEELLRNAFKKYEILEDRIDNYVINIPYHDDNEHYVDVDKGVGTKKDPVMIDKINLLYKTGLNFQDRQRKHYDVANPITYVEPVEPNVDYETECNGVYKNLSHHWLKQIKSAKLQIYEIKKSPNCIFEEIRKAINQQIDDVKTDIANFLCSDDLDDEINADGSKGRSGWQMAKDQYRWLQQELFRNVNTKVQFKDALKSEDHLLSYLDLSIMSRMYNVRFIVLSNPTPKNPSGIACLKTTQSHSDKYILLYVNGLPETFNIIHDTSLSPPESLFSESTLPTNLLKNIWGHICTDDNKSELDSVNAPFRNAPIFRAITVKLTKKTVEMDVAVNSDDEVVETHKEFTKKHGNAVSPQPEVADKKVHFADPAHPTGKKISIKRTLKPALALALAPEPEPEANPEAEAEDEDKPEQRPTYSVSLKPRSKIISAPAPAPDADAEPEDKPAQKPKHTVSLKPKPKITTAPADKPEDKPELAPDVDVDVDVDADADAEPEDKPAQKPTHKVSLKPRSKITTAPAPEAKAEPEDKPAQKPTHKVSLKPRSKITTAPAPAAEAEAEAEAEAKPKKTVKIKSSKK